MITHKQATLSLCQGKRGLQHLHFLPVARLHFTAISQKMTIFSSEDDKKKPTDVANRSIPFFQNGDNTAPQKMPTLSLKSRHVLRKVINILFCFCGKNRV